MPDRSIDESPQELFAKVESAEFDVNANLASGNSIFVEIISADQSIRQLVSSRVTDVDLAIWKRIAILSRTTIDHQYSNPGDAAVAAYLWVLVARQSRLTEAAAVTAQAMPNPYWTARMVRGILAVPESQTSPINENQAPDSSASNLRIYATVAREPDNIVCLTEGRFELDRAA